ncbi:MAG: energy transducer TonB [Calditrichia bacterium]
MNRKNHKIFYIALLVSVLLHVVGFILVNKEYLLGSTAVEQQKNPQPIELVFDQPPKQPEQQMPQKFYELVENPNASGTKPKDTDMLSTQSSLSQAPVIKPGELRAVPGEEVEKNEVEKAPAKQEPDPQLQKAVENALLAYRTSKQFKKSDLADTQDQQTKEADKPKEEKGETDQRPEGFNADLVGDFSLSTYAWEWAPYWLAFKHKLMRLWFPPPAYSELGLIHGYTIVRLKISRDGTLLDFAVLKHVGHPSLEESSVNAMQSMFPFRPLPDDFPDDSLEIMVKMIYPDLRNYNAAR